eukprot:5574216-Pleurochrysis_carterae.AAC.1
MSLSCLPGAYVHCFYSSTPSSLPPDPYGHPCSMKPVADTVSRHRSRTWRFRKKRDGGEGRENVCVALKGLEGRPRAPANAKAVNTMYLDGHNFQAGEHQER